MEKKKEVSYVNIKGVKDLHDGKKIDELLSKVKALAKNATETLKKLSDKEQALKAQRLETQRIERERQEAEASAEAEAETKVAVAGTKVEQTPDKPETVEKEIRPEVVEKVEPVETKQEPEQPSAPKEKPAINQAPVTQSAVKRRDQRQESGTGRAEGQSTRYDRNFLPQRKEYVPQDRRNGNFVPRGQNAQNSQGGYQGNRPDYRNQQSASRQPGQRPQQGAQSPRPFGTRPQKPQEVAFIPKDNNKSYSGKKKQNDRGYEDRHSLNKKQLSKSGLTVEDFDENKTGYRKVRVKKSAKTKEEQRIKIEKAVINKEIIPLKELSEKIGISAVEITKMLFKEGIIKTINDSIDFDTAEFVAANLNIELELKLDKTAEDVLSEGFNEDADDLSQYVPRPPIVTVMGHVDHGKTSLLDRIRQANVTAGEAGGITQHIGAYSVSVKGNKIIFLDTPGHAAFTAMRARGAQVTDIAVIVIAADDGIMPQTIEAINHAKAANVSIIVAANKIDKPHANIEKVRQQLTEHDILVEDWGGDVMLVPVSAKTGEGVDKLLDSILLIAELRELKANPNRKAKGAVVEAKLDKGKGPVATIIVQNGTLRSGDNIVAGTIVGKVRAMFDDKGRMVKEAGPSMAVSVLGLEAVPNAGDIIFAVDQEKLTRLVAQERKNKEREEMMRQQDKVSLDDLFSKINDGGLKRLNIIIKADVQGSVEAVKESLEQLSNENVMVSVIHAGVGAINETDIMLADSSNSIIIGFNVRPDANAKVLAERSKIDVKLYRIIYEAIEDVEKAMKGMLEPKFKDIYMGKAEVRNTFKITGVGMVAGCYVTEGKIVRNGKLRIYRDDVMICEGNVLQLKRFKDDVKEVAQGFECGISIENFNDIKVGDFIESYVVEEQKN